MTAVTYSEYGGPEVLRVDDAGRFSLPVAQAFPFDRAADAHRASEDGHVRGKLVLVP